MEVDHIHPYALVGVLKKKKYSECQQLGTLGEKYILSSPTYLIIFTHLSIFIFFFLSLK